MSSGPTPSSRKFHGKIALVTGGTRGIGAGIVRRLAREGCTVAFTYFTSRDGARSMEEELSSAGCRCLPLRGNLAREGQIEKNIDAVVDRFGGIDYFISNAASGILKPAMELEDKDWNFSYQAIAGAFQRGVQHAAPLMQKRGGGRVIAMASFGAAQVLEDYAAIGSAKAAMASMVRYFAAELMPNGITVNAVSAGIVDTASLQAFPAYQQVVDHARNKTPGGRLTRPEDVAGAVAFLLSEDAAWITGETLTVDGGLTLKA